MQLSSLKTKFVKIFVGSVALFVVVAMPIWVGVWFYSLGVIQLDCQRVEPGQVRCDRTQSHFIGLISTPKTTFDQVTGAERKTKTRSDSDGNQISEHWVVLVTHEGDYIYVKDPLQFYPMQDRTQREMQTLADQINQFLASEESNLSLQWDTRWRPIRTAVVLGLALVFILPCLYVLLLMR
ncbi:MAG: hypothetical protein AAF572_24210 [Cyanobacteria bacterium P01_B01_bin.77]